MPFSYALLTYRRECHMLPHKIVIAIMRAIFFFNIYNALATGE